MTKAQIEAALQPLVGEPLSDMWRYAGYQRFEFGVQRPAVNRRGEAITLADLGLVVACHWRIAGPEGEVVSSDDFGPAGTRRDAKAHPFYHLLHTASPVVETVTASGDGELIITMSQGYALAVRPDREIEPEDEQWRFMPKEGRQGDVVLWGYGSQNEKEDHSG